MLSCPTRQLPQARPPSPLEVNHSVAFSPVFAGPQTMIVHDPRLFWSTTPRWRSVMRRQLPRPGRRETRGEKDEPRLADDALDRQARQSAESYMHACPYCRTRTLPGRTVGRVPGVVRLSAASSPHLTTPTVLALPRSPWPPWRTSRVCAHLKNFGAPSDRPYV